MSATIGPGHAPFGPGHFQGREVVDLQGHGKQTQVGCHDPGAADGHVDGATDRLCDDGEDGPFVRGEGRQGNVRGGGQEDHQTDRWSLETELDRLQKTVPKTMEKTVREILCYPIADPLEKVVHDSDECEAVGVDGPSQTAAGTGKEIHGQAEAIGEGGLSLQQQRPHRWQWQSWWDLRGSAHRGG